MLYVHTFPSLAAATSASSPTATVKTIYSISGRARPNRLIRGRTFSPDGRSYTVKLMLIFTCDDGLGTNDFFTGEPRLLGARFDLSSLVICMSIYRDKLKLEYQQNIACIVIYRA